MTGPMQGKVAVVTGATGEMGQVIALELARAGAQVITVARDPQRAHSLAEQIASEPGRGRLDVITGDLSRRAGIISAAQTILSRHQTLHILVNNAGAHFNDYRLSSDGVEMHVAVDYLAAYGLTNLLQGALRRGRARVINVASDTLRDARQLTFFGPARPVTLDLDDLDDLAQLNPESNFVPFEAYARAKLLTVMGGYDFGRTTAAEGVTVNAVHPGIVATGIVDELIPPVLRPVRGLIRRALLTPEQGAAAALRLAVHPALEGVTGRYFVRDVETPTPPVTYDIGAQERLRNSSDRFFAEGMNGAVENRTRNRLC